MNIRNLITAALVGAVAALLVRELNQYGLAFSEWSLAAPRAGEALITGAVVGLISQTFGQRRLSR